MADLIIENSRAHAKQLLGASISIMSLFSLAIEKYTGFFSVDGNEKARYNIGASLNNFDFEDTDCIGYVDFVISMVRDEEKIAEIRSSYMFGLSSDTPRTQEEWKKIAGFYAINSVWTSFSDAFSLINHQSRMSFPRLPLLPPAIEFDSAVEPDADEEGEQPLES